MTIKQILKSQLEENVTTLRQHDPTEMRRKATENFLNLSTYRRYLETKPKPIEQIIAEALR